MWFFVAIGILTGSAGAQLTDFQGGNLRLEAQGNWSPFAVTSSTGARGAMSEVTTLYPSAASAFGNPAALAQLRGLAVQSDFFLPGLGLGISSERTKLLRSEFRQPLEDMLSHANNHVADATYPDVSLGLYQSSDLAGFSVAHGAPGFGMAMGVQQSFSGSLDAALGGFALGFGVPNGVAGDSVKLHFAGDAFAHLSASLNDFSAAMAMSPRRNLRLGISLHRYAVDAGVDASAYGEGVLQSGGKTGTFNSPGLNYPNALEANAYGHLNGASQGFRLGAAWDLGPHFGLDALVSFTETLRLDGDMTTLVQLPPGFSWTSESILNPARVNGSQLALTQMSSTRYSQFTLVLPWEAGLSLRFQTRDLRINLDYLYYLRGLSLGFDSRDSNAVFDTLTKTLALNAAGKDSVQLQSFSQTYHLGLQQHLALGLELYQVFLHVGALFYHVSEQSLLHESADYQPAFLPFLPTLNLGYFFRLGPHVITTVSLAALPVSLFKTTVEYRY